MYHATHGSIIPFKEINKMWQELSEEQQVEDVHVHRARTINQAAQDELAGS